MLDMTKTILSFILLTVSFFFSCTVSKNYSPLKKYPKNILQQDYVLLKNILEAKHPSLYWYTEKDSMDYYFTKYNNAIKDSMTEQQFAWQILAPLIEKIRCGHTSVGMSKAYIKKVNNKRYPSFPLFVKVWDDTMVVTYNLNKKDSIFKRGTLITAINGISNRTLIEKMFGYLSEDGYANNNNYIRLSANFPYYHRNIYGTEPVYNISYIDRWGNEKTDSVPVYITPKDSILRDSMTKVERKNLPKEKKILLYRSLQIDSSKKFAVMNLNTFSKGKLRRFFRKSFKYLRKENINNLVLDIRSNGGGNVSSSTLLTKYISRKPFKIADTLFTKSRSLRPYSKYIKGKFFNNVEMFFIASRRKDGLYHIKSMEHKLHNPKKKNHYNGEVYVLTNGPTFSASTLFCNAIKGQPGIQLLGEETGGGWYGNNGIMIPDITLPHTHVRVRLPLFRLVQYNHIDKKGTGVMPDIYVPPNYAALLKGVDKKMQVVKELIYMKYNSGGSSGIDHKPISVF